MKVCGLMLKGENRLTYLEHSYDIIMTQHMIDHSKKRYSPLQRM